MFARILVATDGSDDAVRAADAAAELAERFHSRVTLLSVYSPPIISTPEATLFEVEADVIRGLHGDVIARTAAPFDKLGVPYDVRTETGNAAATIVSVAEQDRDDLIILGSHGAGAIRRILLGSTTDRVAHWAHCPVMVIKKPHQRPA